MYIIGCFVGAYIGALLGQLVTGYKWDEENMINDFYMMYRMRTKMTFEVKEMSKSGSGYRQYYVMVTISDADKTFEKSTIIGAKAFTPDKAIEEIMDILSKADVCPIKTATEEELLEWDNLW